MNDEPLAQIEREILGWDGVFKKRDEDGPGGIGVTGYRYGDPETGGPQIGHVHDDGHADFRFPREVRDELISTGRSLISRLRTAGRRRVTGSRAQKM
jgi:hypothetical protein